MGPPLRMFPRCFLHVVYVGPDPIDHLANTVKMSTFDNMMLKLDEAITNILGDWDIYSTSIATVILVFFAYQVFTRRDPDAHPLLLERQSHVSPVRNPGESAVYRSQSS